MIPLSALIEDSEASAEAKRNGLKHVGWGKYADQSGKVVAKSQDGKLVWLNKEPEKTGLGTGKPRRRRPGSAPVKSPGEKKVHLTVKSVKSKLHPSFHDLYYAAKEHTFTIMTKSPIGRVIDNTPVQKTHHKPKGIWFGIRDSWVSWTAENMPDWKGNYLYSVDVDTSKCLVIKNGTDFVKFDKKYGKVDEYGHRDIDWEAVSKEYAGIIIPKYYSHYRMSIDWYYGWDVASGCIWDVSAIKSVKQVPIR